MDRITRLHCAGTEDYYRSTGEAVMVQKSTMGTLGRLRWYSRELKEHSVVCWYGRVL